jgi:hypothetical protein
MEEKEKDYLEECKNDYFVNVICSFDFESFIEENKKNG